MNTAALHAATAALCPIDGVSIGDPADRATWRADYRPEATAEQRAAAASLLAAWVDPPVVGIQSRKRLIQAMQAAGTLSAFAAAYTAVTGKDRMRWDSYDDVPADNPVMGRICAAAAPPIAVSAVFDGAAAQPG